MKRLYKIVQEVISPSDFNSLILKKHAEKVSKKPKVEVLETGKRIQPKKRR